MKQNIHPKFYSTATITCSCGNSAVVGSTKNALTTEICSSCHPFFTGQQLLVDTAGRVDKFKKRAEASKEIKAKTAEKKPRKPRGAKK